MSSAGFTPSRALPRHGSPITGFTAADGTSSKTAMAMTAEPDAEPNPNHEVGGSEPCATMSDTSSAAAVLADTEFWKFAMTMCRQLDPSAQEELDSDESDDGMNPGGVERQRERDQEMGLRRSTKQKQKRWGDGCGWGKNKLKRQKSSRQPIVLISFVLCVKIRSNFSSKPFCNANNHLEGHHHPRG